MSVLLVLGESVNGIGRQVASTLPAGETADLWLVGPFVGALVGLALVSVIMMLAFWPSRRPD